MRKAKYTSGVPKTAVPLGTGQGRGAPRTWKKKLLLRLLVGGSIVVVASWGVFTIKPAWWDAVKGRFSSFVSPAQKSLPRYPARPAFTVVPPQRITPTPPTTPPPQQPGIAPRMERPQTLSAEIPPAASSAPILNQPIGVAGQGTVTPPASTPYPVVRPQVQVPGRVQHAPYATSPSSLGVKKEDSELDEYMEIGTLYAQKGNYQKAEELFQKVARESPASAKAHNNLGFVNLKQQKYEMAEREFKEAMRLEPAFALPYYNLACLYTRKGMDVEALISLKRALNRDVRVKSWAMSDEDLARLASDAVFQELVGITLPKKEQTQKQEGGEKQTDAQKPEGMQQQGVTPKTTGTPVGAQQPVMQKQAETLKQQGAQAGAGTPGPAQQQTGIQSQTGTPKQEGGKQGVVARPVDQRRQPQLPPRKVPQAPMNAQNQNSSQGGAQGQDKSQGGTVPNQTDQQGVVPNQDKTQGAASNQNNTQGDAPNQDKLQGAAQNQEKSEGGAH